MLISYKSNRMATSLNDPVATLNYMKQHFSNGFRIVVHLVTTSY